MIKSLIVKVIKENLRKKEPKKEKENEYKVEKVQNLMKKLIRFNLKRARDNRKLKKEIVIFNILIKKLNNQDSKRLSQKIKKETVIFYTLIDKVNIQDLKRVLKRNMIFKTLTKKMYNLKPNLRMKYKKIKNINK